MREIIEKVKDSTTIENVVGETVSLKRSGSNLKGCCPLHNEKTPSFFVRPSAQTFHCYGCGKSGDVIQFIIERDGLSFMDALRLLASKANIDLPQNAFSEDDSIQSNPTTNLKAFAKAFQVRLLINQAQAVSYWQTRGLLEETIIDFGCSYADGSEIDLLIEREKKQAIGIIHSDGKPVFKHRFTIPIFDSMGNVIAWGARAVGTANPKYLNSSTTDIYEKSKILFNLNFARRYIRAKDEVIITEGYPDVMACWQCGIRNVVATCGTMLTDNHIAEIKRICVEQSRLFRVVLAFNNDNSGKKATLRAIPMLVAAGFAVKIVTPTQKDILDVLTSDGNEAVQQLFATVTDGINMLLQAVVDEINPQTGAEVQETAKRMCKIVAVLPENIQNYYIKIVAKWANTDEISINSIVSGAKNVQKNDKKVLRETDTPTIPNFPIHALPPNIRNIIADAEKWIAFPPDFIAAGILGAVAIAAGRKVRLQYIWEEIACMYMLLVAPPGTNKTHPLRFALKPIADKDKAADKKYKQHKLRIINGLEEDKSRLTCPQILFGDFTLEALSDGLGNNLSGIAAYVDEAASWVKNFDRYNKGSDQESWLANWSGGALMVNRKGRKIYVDASSISFIGTIQPGLLDELSKKGRGLNGFVERIVFVMPEKVPVTALKKRKDRDIDAFKKLSDRYTPILNQILDIQMVEVDEDTFDAQMIHFDEAAEDAITDWINKQRDYLDTLENEFTRNIYSKIQTIILRTCLHLHLLQWASENPNTNLDKYISIETVVKSIEIAEYFLLNALKANSLMNFSSPIDKLPHNYKMWYRELPEEFSTADAERIGIKFNISRETIFRMLKNQDVTQPMFRKIGHGKYDKMLY
jgi:DNA primase catalytic core